jgi:hypothetical protein
MPDRLYTARGPFDLTGKRWNQDARAKAEADKRANAERAGVELADAEDDPNVIWDPVTGQPIRYEDMYDRPGAYQRATPPPPPWRERLAGRDAASGKFVPRDAE